ncbi:hypothetical protein Tco_1000420 [Tanacetum coccineum]
MFEMIEQEYESNVSKISITSSTIETKNLELVKEMGDKVKCFDEEKKVFETKISKLEKVLAQRVKDFDDVKTELSRTQVQELQSENEHLKSKVVDFITCQTLQMQVTKLKSENKDLKLSVEKLTNAHEKYFALKEIESLKDEIKSLHIENQDLKSRESELNNLEKVYETKESVLLKDIDQMKSQVSKLVEKL